jgi:hypothetical protein
MTNLLTKLYQFSQNCARRNGFIIVSPSPINQRQRYNSPAYSIDANLDLIFKLV